jgi:hypothetical protein
MCTIWGTGLLKIWARKKNFLNDAWNLKLFKEAEYPNIHFKPKGFREVVDSNGVLLFREPFYPSLYRLPAYLQTVIVFLFFICIYIIGITFFVQWYTAAMLAPVCQKENENIITTTTTSSSSSSTSSTSSTSTLSSFCFQSERAFLFSDRWFYILFQGICLGISLDIFVYFLSVKLLKKFVIKENHPMEAQFNRTMINRLFVINWISFFLWFILIAFVIVPFGKEVETWLAENLKIPKKLIVVKAAIDWEKKKGSGETIIDMSTALVTPLLITQALNLLLDTALPYFVRREKIRASKMIANKMRANPAETLLALSEYQSSLETTTMMTTSSHLDAIATATTTATATATAIANVNAVIAPGGIVQTNLDFRSKIELQMMTPIRIPYIEKELGISIPTLEGFENEKCNFLLQYCTINLIMFL